MFDRFCLRALVLAGLLLPVASCSSNTSLTSIVISPAAFTTTVAVSQTGESLPPAEQLWTQYTATGYYGHAGHQTTKDITNEVNWLSYTPLLVTVNSSGVATVSGQATGFTQITASAPGFSGDIISNASTFTVNAPSSGATTDIVSLSIIPANPTVTKVPATLDFSAIGTSGAGATQNVTAACTWVSSNPAVATIGATTGIATTVSAGTTAIIATYTNTDGMQATAYTLLTVQ